MATWRAWRDWPQIPTTSVDAVVSVYGLYDWQDRSTKERDHFMRFLERIVVKRSQARHPEVFLAASPIEQTHASAPPFLVVHGSADGIIPVAEARSFVARLRRYRVRKSDTSSYPVSDMVSTWSTPRTRRPSSQRLAGSSPRSIATTPWRESVVGSRVSCRTGVAADQRKIGHGRETCRCARTRQESR